MASLFSIIRRRIATLSPSLCRRHLSLSPTPAPLPDTRFLRHSSPHPRLIDHSPFLSSPEVRVSTLPNGIRVATQSTPSANTRVASVGVYFDAGSRFEAPGTNGTAHFLEHMIFKGTRHRTAQSLEEEIENIGARLNAYTSREQTTYYADVQSKDVGVAIDVLADILQNSRFPDHAIKRERGVILREMEEVQGQMEEVIFDHLHAAAFKGHSLGNTILGPEEKIRTIDKADLQRYISTHYTGHRMVISAAGAVEHEEIVKMVGKLFKNFSTDPTTANQLVDCDPAVFTGLQARVENEDMDLVHLAIAFKGASWADPNSIPLMVAQSLLGSWSKSIGVGNCSGAELARRVSTDGLAESIMSFNTNYRDTGLFGIYATAMGMSQMRSDLVLEVPDSPDRPARGNCESDSVLEVSDSPDRPARVNCEADVVLEVPDSPEQSPSGRRNLRRSRRTEESDTHLVGGDAERMWKQAGLKRLISKALDTKGSPESPCRKIAVAHAHAVQSPPRHRRILC